MNPDRRINRRLPWQSLLLSPHPVSYHYADIDHRNCSSNSTNASSNSLTNEYPPSFFPEVYDIPALPNYPEPLDFIRDDGLISSLPPTHDSCHISNGSEDTELDGNVRRAQFDGISEDLASFGFSARDIHPSPQIKDGTVLKPVGEHDQRPYGGSASFSFSENAIHNGQYFEDATLIHTGGEQDQEVYEDYGSYSYPEMSTHAVQHLDDDMIKSDSEHDQGSREVENLDSPSVVIPDSSELVVRRRGQTLTGRTPNVQVKSSKIKDQRRNRKAEIQWELQELDGSNVLLKLDGIEFNATTRRYQSRSKPKMMSTCREICNGVECGKRYQRREHLVRHALSHSRERKFRCKICTRAFSRKDNRDDHYWTHVFRPGTRSRNKRMSLQDVLQAVSEDNPNVTTRLIEKWESGVLNMHDG